MAAACPLGAVRPRVDTLLLDLDDTLYRVEAVPELVRERIMGQWGGGRGRAAGWPICFW